MRARVKTGVLFGGVLAVVIGLPLAGIWYQARRTGLTWPKLVSRSARGMVSRTTGLESMSRAVVIEGEPSGFFSPQPIGDGWDQPPWISHVRAVDLDQDGLLDVVVCDCRRDQVSWIRQHPRGEFHERVCADGLLAPAHAEAVDMDGDGDLDLLVAVLGMLMPCNDRIGSVVLLENSGHLPFVRHVVADRIARVSDVRAGDLDEDGDLDLAVAQFGYDDGQTRWMENRGGWEFASHVLQNLSGPIHSEIADVDGDGHLDIVVLVSQEWEEIYVFRGDGRGGFQPRRIFGSDNADFGSSGISVCDFDRDGDPDVLYSNGDAFDYIPPEPRPWHGIQWLENRGNLDFRVTRIADFPGAYSPRAGDADRDGDWDLFVVSAFNFWDRPTAESLIWLENTGRNRFRRHGIPATPTHLLALDLGDFDGDGRLDLVTGSMHAYPPYDRMGRVILWRNEGRFPSGPVRE